ncbi:hypothetical protein [Streptomyces sp. IBSBF 2435]|uniref:hypothetical protein n=1 Tax=Streptomyces sp. IBSBF 2435 TaxID=2903531 RepID=UPI003FA6F950
MRKLAPGPARDIITDEVSDLQGHAGLGSILAVVGIAAAVWSASGYVSALPRMPPSLGRPQGRSG